MDETQESLPAGTQPKLQTSLAGRLMNMFVAPGEVYDEVKNSPPTPSNWVAPLILAIIAAVIYSMVIFSQPAILQSMKEANEKQMQAKVEAGKITQKDADNFNAISEKYMTPTFLKAIGVGGSVIGNPAMLFMSGAILWLIGKYGLHGQFCFMKAVEVVGLSFMISVLGAIVTMLLVVIYQNIMMNPGPVLLIGHFDRTNRLHLVLANLNLVTLWWIAVVALGLARLSGTTFRKAAAWLFGIWAVITGGSILLFGGK